jgi:hypothetical protein
MTSRRRRARQRSRSAFAEWPDPNGRAVKINPFAQDLGGKRRGGVKGVNKS